MKSPCTDINISIAVTTHRRPTYLREALNSIFLQSLKPDEVVVSEDGRDDETGRVVESFSDLGLNIRHIIHDPPLGQLRNRQEAFMSTNGVFVAMLDDDDQWEPAFVEKAYDALSNHPDCGFCSADHFIMDVNGEILINETETASRTFGRSAMTTGSIEDVLVRVLTSKPFSFHTTMFRRSALARIGFFPPYAGTIPDFALMMELGAAKVHAYYINERLGRYRVHQGQQTKSRIENSVSILNVLRAFCKSHRLAPLEMKLIATIYRRTVIELAIAYAHVRDTKSAIRAIRSYGSLGFGMPSISRLAVLTLLLLGLLLPRYGPKGA